MEIAGEMQVHLFHRNNLCVSAPRGPALHSKTRPQRSLSDADRSLLANRVQAITQTNRGGCFTLACRCWIDGSHEDQMTIFLV